ncbi:MAG: hypothetical protein M3O01_10540 [Pseudomonadota bacterium]|nr:hypothetical protein [Pseudomonadota bacterium]
MLHDLKTLFAREAVERVTLLVNHLLAGEPVANDRLRKHAGRCMQFHFEGWPARLPALPPMAFRVTPAGLIEWCGDDAPPNCDLLVSIEAGNPALALARAFSGQRPKVEVSGDAAFATDLNWLFDNLRWDMEDDLARLVGEAPAREIARLAAGVAAGIRALARSVGGVVARGRGAPPSSPR